MSLHLRRLFLVVISLAAGLCCYWSVRLGAADWLSRKPTLEAATGALKLAPGNAAYLRNAADIVDAYGADGARLRERAAHDNPLDAANWIRLAATAEIENRLADAERDLLRAFNVDRQFEPRWALANFYYRQRDRERALIWVRRTLEFGAGDLAPVFRFCWTLSESASEIQEKAIPCRREVLGQYLAYLDAAGRIDAAGNTAKVLLPVAGIEQKPVLEAHCTRCLNAGRIDCAIETWNVLIAHKWTQGERVAPELGQSMVNAAFARQPTGVGFDWRVERVNGVTVERDPRRPGLRVEFSRAEPESCEIVGQYAAVVPARKYRFHFRYETANMSGAGNQWRIYDPATKSVLLSAGPDNDTAGEHAVEAQFETPPACRLVRIELRYAREPGTVRPEGSIRFSDLQLGLVGE